MPVIRKKLEPESPRHQELVKALKDELRRDQPAGAGPVIEEEEQRGNRIHVQVVWDEWDDVSNEERGRIIMDAYEQARPDDLPRITIALGLTTAEARKLGVAVG